MIDRSARSTSPVIVIAGRRADVVSLPGSRLENEIVGVVVREERPPPVLDLLLERVDPARVVFHISRRHHSCEYSQPSQHHPVRFDALPRRRRCSRRR